MAKICPNCHGRGWHNVGLLNKQECRVCEGTGQADITEEEICPNCYGRGWHNVGLLDKQKCRVCNGTGRA